MINLSLLLNSPINKSFRFESSSTISSDMEIDYEPPKKKKKQK